MIMTCEHCGKGVTGQYCHACGKAATKAAVNGGAKRKVLGVCLIIGPWIGLVVILSFYAIASFVISAVVGATASSHLIETAYAQTPQPLSVEDFFDPSFTENTGLGEEDDVVSLSQQVESVDGDLNEVIANLVYVILGFMGVLCVIGIFVGTPVGIYLLATDGKPKAK